MARRHDDAGRMLQVWPPYRYDGTVLVGEGRMLQVSPPYRHDGTILVGEGAAGVTAL